MKEFTIRMIVEGTKATPGEDLLQGPKVKAKEREKASPEEDPRVTGGALPTNLPMELITTATGTGPMPWKEVKETINRKTRSAGIGAIKVLAPGVTDVPLRTKDVAEIRRDRDPLK